MRVQHIARALTPSVALAAIGLIAAPAPASAAEDRKEVKTRVLSQQHPTYGAAPGELYVSGHVRSSDEECERRRRVKVFEGQQGPQVDNERADGRGRFFLLWHDQNPPEHYLVKAPRSFPREDRSLKCEADEKRLRMLPPPSEAGGSGYRPLVAPRQEEVS